MSDTPCVDGCGQDAATIERLREQLAKVEALAARLAQIHNRLHGDVEINRQEHRRGERDLARWLHDDLRAALSPQNHPRSAADAPEAPGQPGRGEGAAQGDSEALDDALRRHRHEWDEYIDAWGSAKGVPEPTPQRIVAALRSPRPPFGVAEGQPDARP